MDWDVFNWSTESEQQEVVVKAEDLILEEDREVEGKGWRCWWLGTFNVEVVRPQSTLDDFLCWFLTEDLINWGWVGRTLLPPVEVDVNPGTRITSII